ncbi:peptidoglycan/LPS O-acetylase OafA/YrhL [Kitasatospora sp. MAA19]|uniref:acyltransferase family protein n=1 Tax=unclassified Kitasatospora TaxID=2633591 RepID=UPI0024759C87|nr:acyltransferase [Kitasatospora sp. MAA19]MDH6705358.1 peptidoglycan/LPS O-acetylase OafA/YrhL [Kitasatospora sp. MAA19]
MAHPLTALRSAARQVDARTPETRDRALDGLRALALLAVPVGHWLLGGFTLSADGALHNASPLSALGGLAPISWVLQMLGVFFLVGGHSSVQSLERARAKGVTYPGWMRGRTVRLLRPVLGVTAVWALLIALLPALGVPSDTVRTGATLVVQPLWYIAVYLGLTALTPLCVAAGRRLGGWSAGALVAAVATVDLLRYGPWAEAMPSWVGLLNILPGWLFGYQLGVLWAQGRLGRPTARVLLLGGGALFATLLVVFHYPASMVGVPGVERTNSHPPSLLVLALAATQCGAAVLLRERLGRLLTRRPLLWLPVVVVNLSAMTIFCWHQSAMLAVAVPGAAGLGALPGLTTAPDSVGWVAARVALLPLFGAVLVAIGWFTRRFDGPWTAFSRAGKALAAAGAALFAAYALGMV